MWEKLQSVFELFKEKYNFDYSRQGSYLENEELPESFFTFWNIDTNGESFYDNHESKITYNWIVYFYTKNPILIYSIPDELVDELKKVGFIIKKFPSDYKSDEVEHLCRYITITYLQGV